MRAHRLDLSGKQTFTVGDLEIALLLGAPAEWGAPAAEGVTIRLIDIGGDTMQFNFGMLLHGVGAGIGIKAANPLVDDSMIRIGAINFLPSLTWRLPPD